MNPLPSDEPKEEPTIIQWLSGTTHITKEHRVEGNVLVFGYRIDDGDFEPTCSMVFDSAEGLNQAVAIADTVGRRRQ